MASPEQKRMPVVIGAKQESDFNDPVGVLSDCHRRIERFLGVLLHVARELEGGELSHTEKASFENALRYFREAAPKHTADEEESLFPRLKARNDAALQPLLATIESLEEEHACADRLHGDVDRLGRHWLATGNLSASEAAQLSGSLEALQTIYRRHIQIEDTQVFPAAKAILTAEEQRLTGAEMRQRRQPPDRPL
jgi:hemerythrin-like domain-containing protein